MMFDCITVKTANELMTHICYSLKVVFVTIPIYSTYIWDFRQNKSPLCRLTVYLSEILSLKLCLFTRCALETIPIQTEFIFL